LKLRGPIIDKLGGLAVTGLVYPWMRTLRYYGDAEDWSFDPAQREFAGPAIFVFWHEYIPILFYLRGHCHITMLLSRHQDAEWLSQAAGYMGFGTVRGSSNRGGAAALREIMRKSPWENLAITPDGPRGPRRVLAVGPVYLASRLQMPIIPVGLGYNRPWRVKKAWDQFAIPKPFSRACGIVGAAYHVPETAERDELEHHQLAVQNKLNALTNDAEAWAASGETRAGSRRSKRQGSPYTAAQLAERYASSHRKAA
jgi:lysophospholipid acyltransferase (LPLAT)-like uncharacterized protein